MDHACVNVRAMGEQSRAIVDAAIKRATDMRVAVSIAVVDAAGHLRAFWRMDTAILGSIDIAERKAKTAVYFGMESEAVGRASQPGGPFYGVEHSNGGLITFVGGVPLLNTAGEVIGAVGVSGGLPEQDGAIARAGAAAAAGAV
jgi:uncharacterized protein GlcG (DUF336 family)